MLVIVNPYATTVSDRLQATSSSTPCRAATTSTRSTPSARATRSSCAARPPDEGYDVVVAFGGDGTVNEAANGLAGTEHAADAACPAASTNVFCKMLGIPNDIVDATEHLLRMADDWEPRAVDLGRVNGRASRSPPGSGSTPAWSSASTAHPHLKRRFGA